MGLRTWLGLKKRETPKPEPQVSIDDFMVAADQVPEHEKTRSDIHRIVYGNVGPASHKWHHYLEIYDRHLSPYRGTPVRLLEIGVQNGGSLKMWREYLGPKAKIFGIDIDPACAALDGESAKVRIGSQSDETFLNSVINEMGGVDVVIDDGSHVGSDQRASLLFLYPLLSERGVYVCEDTHSSYWPTHDGGWRKSGTFIELTKALIDDMHQDFSLAGTFHPAVARQISGVHIYNSMVVFDKAPPLKPQLVLVGSELRRD